LSTVMVSFFMMTLNTTSIRIVALVA
jgi:hypothetical protein